MITVESEFGTYSGLEGDGIILQLQKFGAHTRPELCMVIDFIRPGETIIDVGGHIGTFAIPFWIKAQPGGTVTSFEANPKTFELLKHNIAQNSSGVKAVCCGISDSKGPHYLKDRGKRSVTNSGGDYLVAEENGTFDYVIELVKIDDIAKSHIDIIKIDVEGMEISVLRSAALTIDNYRPLIYAEYCPYFIRRAGLSPEDFYAFFKNRNYHYFINAGERNAANNDYQLVKVPGPKYTRGQVDFLMIPCDSERYPTNFKNWYSHAFLTYIYNRFRNSISSLRAIFAFLYTKVNS